MEPEGKNHEILEDPGHIVEEISHFFWNIVFLGGLSQIHHQGSRLVSNLIREGNFVRDAV